MSNTVVNRLKLPVHIEVQIAPSCTLKVEEIAHQVKTIICEQCPIFVNGPIQIKDLDGIASTIIVCDLLSGQKISFWQADLFIHPYRLVEQPPENDYLEGEEELPVAEQMELPNKSLHGLWESIIVEDSIKSQLLSFSCTSILFAEANIDANIIAWNKMLLLYGPPGTGKTSLCKALAHKVYIRNSERYQSGLLFEVNCHSLFSKWFSESGKLVMKLFTHIAEVAEDPESFVVLLIDEVESIASARNASSRSGEPGDAIRVVNAVLTSLDNLKRKSNVLVLCTSNMVTSLDEAFVDRLDFKVCIGLPNYTARVQIISSCLKELILKGVVLNDLSCNLDDDKSLGSTDSESIHSQSLAGITLETLYRSVAVGDRLSSLFADCNKLLHYLATITDGKSGRALRKLPIKSHTLFQQRIHITLADFLLAMIATIQTESG